MRLHERTMIVQGAGAEIRRVLLNLRVKHDLTDIEFLGILADTMQLTLKFALRVERHPEEPGRAGDAE